MLIDIDKLIGKRVIVEINHRAYGGFDTQIETRTWIGKLKEITQYSIGLIDHYEVIEIKDGKVASWKPSQYVTQKYIPYSSYNKEIPPEFKSIKELDAIEPIPAPYNVSHHRWGEGGYD